MTIALLSFGAGKFFAGDMGADLCIVGYVVTLLAFPKVLVAATPPTS
jgi:hypothetical protein